MCSELVSQLVSQLTDFLENGSKEFPVFFHEDSSQEACLLPYSF